MARVLFVCTGNATRSVLAASLLAHLRPDLEPVSSGTLVIEGCPPSARTRAAFEAIDLDVPSHRSSQTRSDDLIAADAVVALAPEHVGWVRREHPSLADHTVTLKRLHRDLEPGPRPLHHRVRDLGPRSIEVEAWEEVVDPGGQEVDAYVACALEIRELMIGLAERW
jgi:protein-tyrosine-phosphatase